MKKLLVLMLAVLVLASVVLVAVACSEEEGTETSESVEATESTEAAPAALTVAEVVVIGNDLIADFKAAGEGADAAEYVEEDVTFVGEVYAISPKADIYVVRVGTEEESFSVVIPKENEDLFGGAEGIDGLVGRTFVFSGDIAPNSWGSIAELTLSDPAQMVEQM